MGILPQSEDDQVAMDLLGIGKGRRIADGRFRKTGLVVLFPRRVWIS